MVLTLTYAYSTAIRLNQLYPLEGAESTGTTQLIVDKTAGTL
jgi:hypothetical protein